MLLARRAGIPIALRLDSVLFEVPPPRMLAKRLLFDAFLKRAYRLFFGTGTLTLDVSALLRRARGADGTVSVRDRRRGLPARCGGGPGPTGRDPAQIGLPAEARVLLSLAKLHPREAPWDLLRAFARNDDPQTWLALAGDGPSRAELEAFAREHGLTRVAFLGYVPYPRLPELYASADLFVHPAREERWGVSVAEAMACGLPVITSSRVGAARDLLVAGENGFTYQAGDDEELSRRIEEALRLPPAAVSERNRAILAHWDYAATWRHLIEATLEVAR